MRNHPVATTTVPDVSVGHALLQMVLALAVIIACIVILTKVLSRLRSGGVRNGVARGARRDATRGLTVISRQPLGKDLSIAAVRWGEREVLVGIAGSTITFLDDRDHGNELSAAPDTASAEGPATASMTMPSFADRISTAAGSTRDDAGARASLLDALRDATLRH